MSAKGQGDPGEDLASRLGFFYESPNIVYSLVYRRTLRKTRRHSCKQISLVNLEKLRNSFIPLFFLSSPLFLYFYLGLYKYLTSLKILHLCLLSEVVRLFTSSDLRDVRRTAASCRHRGGPRRSYLLSTLQFIIRVSSLCGIFTSIRKCDR